MSKPRSELVPKESEPSTQALPGVGELAQLAAMLNQGRAVNEHSAAELASQALLLYQACQRLREERVDRAKMIREMVASDEDRFGGIQAPSKWPATLKEFQRLVIGGRLIADRMAIYRRFLGHLMKCDRMSATPGRKLDYAAVPEPDPTEIAALIAREKEQGFTEALYHDRAMAYVVWREQTGEAARHRKAKHAAAKRHA